MLDFLSGIFEYLLNCVMMLVEFVFGIFTDIAMLIKLTAKFISMLSSMFSWLPAEAAALLLGIFGVVVVYKVLGREG